MKTDEQLQCAVTEELEWEPTVTWGGICVAVSKGVVTLSGTVPHYAEKWAAERATQRVEGVKAIVEELQVNLTGVHKYTDSEIAGAVVNSLSWHVWVPSHVQATVKNGWVTLSGNVKMAHERAAAEDAVEFLAGVKGVTNSIMLTPIVEMSAIKNSIEKALQRDSEIDASHIRVSTSGSRVTLEGTVGSWDERAEADTTAWNAPGVHHVDNHLAVSC
jgi:osmotically-inducible protein OsmY